MASPFRLLLLVIFIVIFSFGIFDYLTNFEKNGCEMTYMYEIPEYLPVPLLPAIRENYPAYGLYLYGEGKYAEQSQSMRLSGIPVLFIPGNAGSYRQVRSLGSVAHRKVRDGKLPFHFNYFSIDFNEEFSGLFGGVLYRQTEFVHECVKKILTMYNGASSPPKTVVLVGHSMGGVLARALFTLPDFKKDTVHTIITQATPHQSPVVAIDTHIASFYENMNAHWTKYHNSSLRDVTVFSMAGGYRDIQVRGSLTSLDGLVSLDRSISINTMSAARAWVSTDHLCHVWCKQTVLDTKRALFDSIDRTTKQMAVSPSYRWRAFHHHFVHNPGPKRFKGAYNDMINLDSSIKWEIRRKPSWKFSTDKLLSTRYSAMIIPPDTDIAFVAISNIPNEEWIGACSLNKEQEPKAKKAKKQEPKTQCSKVGNFAPWANMIPPLYSEKKAVHIDVDKLKEFTHLVAVLPKSKERIDITAELYAPSKRHLVYNVTTLLDFLKDFPRRLMNPDIIVKKTEPLAVFYNISLGFFDIPLQAYTLHLTALKCTDKSAGSFRGTLMKLHVPWSREDTYSFIRPGENGNLSLKLQVPRPHGFPSPAQLYLYLLPTCSYRVGITIAWGELFGQFVRTYGFYLPAFLAVQLMMILSWQLKRLDENGEAPSAAASHHAWAQPWRVVPVGIALRVLLCFPEDDNISLKLGLPLDDSIYLGMRNLWYGAMPIMLYLTSYAIAGLGVPITQGLLIAKARVIEFLFGRCIRSPLLQTVFTRGQYLWYLVCAVMSFTMCGGLGLALTYFMHCYKTMMAYIFARHSQVSDHRIWNKFNIHFGLLLLLLMATALNAPSAITWGKDLSYSAVLTADSARWVGVIASLSMFCLSITNFPYYIGELYGVVAAVFYILSVLLTLYAVESIYRINYVVCIALVTVALCSIFGYLAASPVPQKADTEQEGEPQEEEMHKEDDGEIEEDKKTK